MEADYHIIQESSRIIIFCTMMISLGKLIDWFLRKREKDKILESLKRFELLLAKTSIIEWQWLIAKYLLDTLNNIRNFWRKLIFVFEPDDDLAKNELKRNLWAFLIGLGDFNLDVIRKHKKDVFYGMALLFLLLIMPLSLYLWGIKNDIWFFTTLLLPGLFIMMFVIIALITAILVLFIGKKMLDNIDRFCFRIIFRHLIPISIVNTIFSNLAIAMGFYLYSSFTKGFWIQFVNSDRSINGPIILNLLNFPFNYLTIYLSIKIIKYIYKNKNLMTPLAILDIISSVFLSILLYTIILCIENSNINIYDNFCSALKYIIRIIDFRAGKDELNWTIVPLLFTTLIPVSFYMSIFIFLGIILKPLITFSSYLCKLLGEKEKSPFAELSIAMSFIIVIYKGLMILVK